MKIKINYPKIYDAMKQEAEDNFCSKCKICGIVVSYGEVENHLKKHMEELK